MPRRKQEPQKFSEPESKKPKEDDIVENEVEEVNDKNGSADDEKNKIKLTLPEEYGEVLICGGANWSLNGRSQVKKGDEKFENSGRNLFKIHRYKSLIGVKVSKVISGCCSSHNLLITTDSKVFSWGRNELGQLGHGGQVRYDTPQIIDCLKQYNVVNAATGKNHTLCLTDDGKVFAFGDNNCGQLGLGKLSTMVPKPTRISYNGNPIVEVSCGGEFSAILDHEGYVYTFGCPEYGQLGNNTDGKYIARANKIGYNNVKNAFRIPLWVEKEKGISTPIADVKIKSIACGGNHVVALDSHKRVFTWGFGGYGRLGHSEQKDEHTPRLVKLFDRPGRGAVKIYAGFSYSLALNEMGTTMFWGLQGSISRKETTMYPKPVADLHGWKVRSIGCGYRHTAVVADENVIVWGGGTSSGELGLGESRKSSSNPDLMKSNDIHMHSVTCGHAHTIMIARTSTDKDMASLDELPVYDPVACP